MCGLWSQIHEHGLDSEDDPIPASAALDMVQRTLVLIGNANQLLSEKSRLGLLKSIDPNLIKYANGEFPEAGKELFGSEFAKEIVDHVKQIQLSAKHLLLSTEALVQFYRRGKAQRHRSLISFDGAGLGAWHRLRQEQLNPCNKSSTFRGRGRGRYNLQSSSSVFSRLGPNPNAMDQYGK